MFFQDYSSEIWNWFKGKFYVCQLDRNERPTTGTVKIGKGTRDDLVQKKLSIQKGILNFFRGHCHEYLFQYFSNIREQQQQQQQERQQQEEIRETRFHELNVNDRLSP